VQEQRNYGEIRRLKSDDELLMMGERRPTLSHHLQRSHVLLGRRPEQRKAGGRGIERGMGIVRCNNPLLHGSGNQEIPKEGQAGVIKELAQMHNMDVF
jgi:hypothetical protein